MCCKIPGIPEIGKPPNAWCPNCEKGRGCRVYDQRPEPCRAFYCLWKVMPDFPEELRPDRCKVLWQLSGDGKVAIATAAYPEALQTRRQHKLAQSFRCLGVRIVLNSLVGQAGEHGRPEVRADCRDRRTDSCAAR